MIEDRIVWAVLLIAAMAMFAGWLALSTLNKRREFNARQAGRNKHPKSAPLEPAE
jgi:hypothetical protein